MASWIQVKPDSDFPLRNLPYGVFSPKSSGPRIGVAIGDYVLDLKVLAQEGVFSSLGFDTKTLEGPVLNTFAGLGKAAHRAVRQRLQDLLDEQTKDGKTLRDNAALRKKSLHSLNDVTLHLPMDIGDYTDFFVGLPHAQNGVNILANGAPIETLAPSFFSLPIGYGGRSSSIVVSGTPFRRPRGQYPVDGKPSQQNCQKLDFESEFACFIGKGNDMGESIDIDQAEDHIFGVVLMNDWSARDIQFWEAKMMGPLNGKNFCTTVSPWVVPLEALEPFRVAPMKGDREYLPYLAQKRKESAYNIPVTVTLEADSETYHVAKTNTNNVVFSLAQMVAHHTRGGCPLRSGDLLATGTLSGPTREEEGCFFELTRNGEVPYEMKSVSSPQKKLTRTFLEDGDILTFKAQASNGDGLGAVGFGACSAQVLPAYKN